MSTSIRAQLAKHIQQKWENREWLADCLDGKKESFPYRPEEGAKPELSAPFKSPFQANTELEEPAEGDPLFLVNIPMRRLPSRTYTDYTNYTNLLAQIRDESFGTTAATSQEEINKRVGVVIGINQIQSIDSALNRAFRLFVRHLPPIQDIVSRTIGFFWKPKWEAIKKNVYPLPKAFRVLKFLSRKRAEEVRKTFEQPKGLTQEIVSQVPFQRIRETIKNCGGTRSILQDMVDKGPSSPIYFTTMDADTVSFRSPVTDEGIFSRMTDLIEERDHPSIISLGYSLPEEEAPLLRLAVKVDMAVRSVMPLPYLPEPCTGFKVRKPDTPHFLRAFTFLGAGRSLESRRFRDSAPERLADGVAFKSDDGGVVTGTPPRMKTKANQKVRNLTPATLKRKTSLQSLRGRTIQSHAFPKQWADIMYAGLPFSCPRVTDATAPMMHLFSVYDPISRMFDASRYSATVFDQVMDNYSNPLTAAQKNTITTARNRLYNLGMKKGMIDLIQETARRSGLAIHQILQEEIEAN
jgi:hypothetical protein